MPEQRIYTIRGKRPAAVSHGRIQLASFDPKMMYQILEFKIMPAGTPTQADQYGVITLGQKNSADPSDPDFSDQNEIAWAHHSIRQPSPPGVGESVSFYNYEVNDEKLFNYDVHLHTVDATGNEEVNYFIKILRYRVSAETGSIGSLRQFQYNTSET